MKRFAQGHTASKYEADAWTLGFGSSFCVFSSSLYNGGPQRFKLGTFDLQKVALPL